MFIPTCLENTYVGCSEQSVFLNTEKLFVAMFCSFDVAAADPNETSGVTLNLSDKRLTGR